MTTIGMPERRVKTANVSFGSIVIPTEHGGWGIVLEPALVALIAAPSKAGLLIVLAAIFTFLVRQPARMTIGDLLVRRRVFPRTTKAVATTIALGAAAVSLLAGAWILAGLTVFLPLAAAAPLALIQIGYDARNRGRNLFPEIAGAVAMGASAAMILLAADSAPAAAAALWLVMALRTTSAIVYVRTRLRRTYGRAASALPALAVHAVAIVIVAALALAKLAPVIAALVFVVLTMRAASGLTPAASGAAARKIGFMEVGWGMSTILAIGLGLRLGL